ncbi:hypothetical protein QBC46DRAFT_271662, partial [Diplogelasinospora grovesii]
KVYKRFNERLSMLRSKIKELNAITEGRAIIVWIYKSTTLTYGDKQLLNSLSYNI